VEKLVQPFRVRNDDYEQSRRSDHHFHGIFSPARATLICNMLAT
jgi:hypothetical protein